MKSKKTKRWNCYRKSENSLCSQNLLSSIVCPGFYFSQQGWACIQRKSKSKLKKNFGQEENRDARKSSFFQNPKSHIYSIQKRVPQGKKLRRKKFLLHQVIGAGLQSPIGTQFRSLTLFHYLYFGTFISSIYQKTLWATIGT